MQRQKKNSVNSKETKITIYPQIHKRCGMKKTSTPRLIKLFMSIGALAFCALLFSACNKPEPPEVKSWTMYQNTYGTELIYPKDWFINDDAKEIKIYPTRDIAQSFGPPPDVDAKRGVEIRLGYKKYKEAATANFESFKENTKAEIAAMNNVSGEDAVAMGKENGTKISYHARIGSKTMIYGYRIIVPHDSAFYYLNFEAFNEDFELYKFIMDTVIASIKLPKIKAKITDPNEAAKPTAEFTRFFNDVVEVQYPDNFECSDAPKKGEITYALNIRGLRQDCDVVFDSQPAKKLTVEKAFEQMKGKFNPQSTGDATVDGTAAKYLLTTPAPNIERKMYFTVKNDKLYRVILTWYKPLAKDFQPAFERVVASLKLK
jgi:hypothetical protein